MAKDVGVKTKKQKPQYLKKGGEVKKAVKKKAEKKLPKFM